MQFLREASLIYSLSLPPARLLYVSQDGASTVEVLTLPSLISAATINLGSSSTYGPYYAMDLQAAPNADSTVAIVLGTPGISPQEEGGVIIYDSGTARTNVICGWIQTGCPNPSAYLMDSIRWKSDGSEMYAANYESSGFDFYTIPVTASGFGAPTDYPGDVPGYFYRIHYDAPTGYVYDDDGGVVNPSNGASVGTFSASGLMVPDGTMGTAFFLGQTQQQAGTTAYTIESFNIPTLAAVSTYTIFNVVGTPTHLIRWGTNGLAFTTIDTTQSPAVGDVYLISGSFVSRSAKRAAHFRKTCNAPGSQAIGTADRPESARESESASSHILCGKGPSFSRAPRGPAFEFVKATIAVVPVPSTNLGQAFARSATTGIRPLAVFVRRSSFALDHAAPTPASTAEFESF